MDELHALAAKIGAEQSDDQITLIYNIIDKESEVGSMEVPAEAKPKKRGRKSKAEKEAEAAILQELPLETTEAPAATPSDTPEETPQPKKRGRKPKAEKDAETERNRQMQPQRQPPSQEPRNPRSADASQRLRPARQRMTGSPPSRKRHRQNQPPQPSNLDSGLRATYAPPP